jgi:hypothetical protein
LSVHFLTIEYFPAAHFATSVYHHKGGDDKGGHSVIIPMPTAAAKATPAQMSVRFQLIGVLFALSKAMFPPKTTAEISPATMNVVVILISF